MATPKTIYTYNLNNSTRQFQVPFDYLAQRFVKVTLLAPAGSANRELVLDTDFRFVSANTIETMGAYGPPAYDMIEVRRYTSATDRLVEFNDASILHADDLNISDLQVIHIAEEARDATTDALSMNANGDMDARRRRIVNLADPIDPMDAVNYRTYRADADGARNSRIAAEAARDQAKSHADNAGNYAANALLSQNASKSSEVAAGNSKTDAGIYASKANDSRNAASVSEATASSWAVKMDGPVAAGEYSSKYWAGQSASSATTAKNHADNSGNYSVDSAASAAKSQEWAIKMDSPVDNGEYSAKYWAKQAEGSAGQVLDPLPRNGLKPMLGILQVTGSDQAAQNGITPVNSGAGFVTSENWSMIANNITWKATAGGANQTLCYSADDNHFWYVNGNTRMTLDNTNLTMKGAVYVEKGTTAAGGLMINSGGTFIGQNSTTARLRLNKADGSAGAYVDYDANGGVGRFSMNSGNAMVELRQDSTVTLKSGGNSGLSVVGNRLPFYHSQAGSSTVASVGASSVSTDDGSLRSPRYSLVEAGTTAYMTAGNRWSATGAWEQYPAGGARSSPTTIVLNSNGAFVTRLTDADNTAGQKKILTSQETEQILVGGNNAAFAPPPMSCRSFEVVTSFWSTGTSSMKVVGNAATYDFTYEYRAQGNAAFGCNDATYGIPMNSGSGGSRRLTQMRIVFTRITADNSPTHTFVVTVEGRCQDPNGLNVMFRAAGYMNTTGYPVSFQFGDNLETGSIMTWMKAY